MDLVSFEDAEEYRHFAKILFKGKLDFIQEEQTQINAFHLFLTSEDALKIFNCLPFIK